MRQAKLANYVAIPFAYKMPLSHENEPFVQVFNLRDFSFMLYREEQGKPLLSLVTSKLAFKKATVVGLQEYTKDIPDARLKFLLDLSAMTLRKRVSLYLAISTNSIIKIDFSKRIKTVKISVLTLPRDYSPKRILVYRGVIYILEFNKVTRVVPDPRNFSKFAIEEKTLQREFTDMAVVQDTFVFIRGYSSLVVAATWAPEDAHSYTHPDLFHHGKFLYAGFDHFILSRTQDESGDAQYFYFSKDAKSGPAPNGLIIRQLRNSGVVEGKRFTKLIQYQEAVFYLYKKNIEVEYFDAETEPVTINKNIFGRFFGMIGDYNRTIDSVHPLTGFKLRLIRKLRFRKLYLNALHSELVCQKMSELKVGEQRILRATVHTRKNKLEFILNFTGASLANQTPHLINRLPQPAHFQDKKPPTAGKNDTHGSIPSVVIPKIDDRPVKPNDPQTILITPPKEVVFNPPKIEPTLPKMTIETRLIKPVSDKIGIDNSSSHTEKAHNKSTPPQLLPDLAKKNRTIPVSTKNDSKDSAHISIVTDPSKLIDSSQQPHKPKPMSNDVMQRKEFYKRMLQYVIILCLFLVLVLLCLIRAYFKKQITNIQATHEVMLTSNLTDAQSRESELQSRSEVDTSTDSTQPTDAVSQQRPQPLEHAPMDTTI